MDPHSPPDCGSGSGSCAGAAIPGQFAPAFDALPFSPQHTQPGDPLAFTVPQLLRQGVHNKFTQDPPYNLYYSADAYTGLQDGGSGGADGGYDEYKPAQKKRPLQKTHTS